MLRLGLLIVIVGAAACGGSAEGKLKDADKAGEVAREKDEKAAKAAGEAREARSEHEEESTDAAKAVRNERADYRKRLEKEVQSTNAKLASTPGAGAGASAAAGTSPDAQRLAARRDALQRHLDSIGTGTDKDWPEQKRRIDADLDAKGK